MVGRGGDDDASKFDADFVLALEVVVDMLLDKDPAKRPRAKAQVKLFLREGLRDRQF